MSATAKNEALGEFHFDLESYRDKGYLTHNFHPFPAKFVPQIPRYIIERYTQPGDIVLDPFCGSGTTLVEACVSGRAAIGIDLNPLACLISRVKTTLLSKAALRCVDSLISRVEQLQVEREAGSLEVVREAIPDFHNRDHWFASHVLEELTALRTQIETVEDDSARDFAKVAFSAIIVKVSRQESDTRWRAVEKNTERGDALSIYLAKVRDMRVRINKLSIAKPAPAVVYQGAADAPWRLKEGSIDLAVTSPPYLNSFDYYLYHKLRMFWLGYDHKAVQELEIGSRNRHSDKGEGLDSYTDKMGVAVQQLHSVLKKGGRLCVVVGDAVLRGQFIDMGQVYREIASKGGFAVTESFSYDQRKFTTSFTRNLKTIPKRSHILCFQR